MNCAASICAQHTRLFKFVDCAISANADYIVTEDSHFNRLKQITFPRLMVLTLDEFNESLQG